MTPREEQALRLKLQLGLSIAGTTAQMFTTKDPAAGQTIQFALSNATGKYWDENKNFYLLMKDGSKLPAFSVAPVAYDKDVVLEVLADMGIIVK